MDHPAKWGTGMMVRLHKLATTTPATRAYIQQSTASASQLVRELGVSYNTIARWRRRSDVREVTEIIQPSRPGGHASIGSDRPTVVAAPGVRDRATRITTSRVRRSTRSSARLRGRPAHPLDQLLRLRVRYLATKLTTALGFGGQYSRTTSGRPALISCDEKIGAVALPQAGIVASKIDVMVHRQRSAIERTINGLSASDRLTTRKQQSRPIVADLEQWMRTERARLSRHAETAKAIDYMLPRWAAFTRFLDDGRICLSNNAAERALRGVALGRRAWLFAGSDRGGERAAAMYTLIATAKLNDINPQAWLADVLARIADHPVSRLDELLPWHWKLTQDQAAAA
jgi:hypothetical protein